MILGGGAEHVQSMKVLGIIYSKFKKLIPVFKKIQSNFQQKLGLNEKQWDKGEREASTKDLPCSSGENF